eukprot:sb/3477597/
MSSCNDTTISLTDSLTDRHTYNDRRQTADRSYNDRRQTIGRPSLDRSECSRRISTGQGSPDLSPATGRSPDPAGGRSRKSQESLSSARRILGKYNRLVRVGARAIFD